MPTRTRTQCQRAHTHIANTRAPPPLPDPSGSFRIPQGGFKSFKITIRRVDNVNDQLPVAHTCTKSFDLPEYKSEEVFNEKVTLSLKEGIKGFNIE